MTRHLIYKGAFAPFFISLILTLGTSLAFAGPFSSYDYQRWLLILLLSLLAVIPTGQEVWVLSRLGRLLFLCWVAFAAFVVISAILACYADSNSWALFDLMFWVLLTVGTLGLVHLFSENSNLLPSLSKALIASWCFYYLIVVMNYLFVMVSPFTWDKMILTQSAFTNVRFFNQIQVLLFPLMLALASLSRGRWCTIGFLCAVFTVSLVLYSRARGAAVAMFIESLVIVGLIWKFRSGTLALAFVRQWAAIMAFGLVTYVIVFDWFPDWRFGEGAGGALIREGTSGRLAMWVELLSTMDGHWLFGHGGFSYADKSAGITAAFGHPHNSLLQLLYEYGLPATLMFVLFFIGLVTRALKAMGHSDSVYLPYLLASALGGAALSLVSGVIVMPFSQLLLVVIVAALWQSSRPEVEQTLTWEVSSRMRILSFALLALLIAVVWIYALQSYESVMGGETLTFDVGPRFWFVGRME